MLIEISKTSFYIQKSIQCPLKQTKRLKCPYNPQSFSKAEQFNETSWTTTINRSQLFIRFPIFNGIIMLFTAITETTTPNTIPISESISSFHARIRHIVCNSTLLYGSTSQLRI